MIPVIEYTCLCCEAQYMTNKHHCPHGDLCTPKRHRDFCQRCRSLIMGNFRQQLLRKELPPPRLRTEE